jgi:CRISPR-associated protein Cmr6
MQEVQARAVRFRRSLGVAEGTFALERTEGALSLGAVVDQFDVESTWPNPWFALNEVGKALQGCASQWKHKERKQCLGLPRQIDGPGDTPLEHQRAADHQPQHTPPTSLTCPMLPKDKHGKQRHAAPILLSVSGKPGSYRVRATLFVASRLPDETKSGQVLREYSILLRRALEERKNATAPAGTALPKRSGAGSVQNRGGARPAYGDRRGPFGDRGAGALRRGQPPAAPGPSSPFAPGQEVQAILLEEKTRKGGWKAQIQDAVYKGEIQNSDAVPKDRKPGDVVTLVVATTPDDQRAYVAFRWPQ